MHVTVVRPSELGPSERQLWDSFGQESLFGSPYLSWEFAQAVGQARDDARVAVVDEGSGPCAFLAFQVDADAVGRPIGASIADAQAVLCRPDWNCDARELIAGADLCRWYFDHLVTGQPFFVPYHDRRHRSPVVDLRGGHGQFLLDLRAHSKDLLAQVGRRRRKLEREVGPIVCEWQSTRPDDDMAWLARWKSDQYARDGTWDRFAEPWIAATLSRLRQSGDPSLHRRAHRAAGRRPAGRRPFWIDGSRPPVVVVPRLRPRTRPILTRPDPSPEPHQRGGGSVRADD